MEGLKTRKAFGQNGEAMATHLGNMFQHTDPMQESIDMQPPLQSWFDLVTTNLCNILVTERKLNM